MKKAIITDWLDKYGGAERVITAICETIDFDYYYAYANCMQDDSLVKTFGKQKTNVIHSKILSKAGAHFRMFFPFFPFVVKSFNRQTKRNTVDVVVSSSWALSKAYRIKDEIHICYLQARNFKYVWDESHLYFRGVTQILSFLKTTLQRFDINSSKNPDYLISNSVFVQQWVKEKYGRDSIVIYPPVEVNKFFISDCKDEYYITIGRIEPYKRFDIIIDAFNKNGRKLIVIGDGSELSKLKKASASNIVFLGFCDQQEISRYLSKAQAFVYAGVEDFGIALVEAMASGVPVLAYDGGASTEIVSEGSGILFSTQSADSLNSTILKFESCKHKLLATEIRKRSLAFSKDRFVSEFKKFYEQVTMKRSFSSNDIGLETNRSAEVA